MLRSLFVKGCAAYAIISAELRNVLATSGLADGGQYLTIRIRQSISWSSPVFRVDIRHKFKINSTLEVHYLLRTVNFFWDPFAKLIAFGLFYCQNFEYLSVL